MQQGLMSELDAVNKILAVAGDSPVQTLEDSYQQAKLARQILTRASRDVQAMKWWFNEEQDVSLSPDTGGNITLPLNAITATANADYGDIVQRGQRMYNRGDRTYLFSEAISVDLVLALEWTELPQEARQHITNVACTQYNNDFFGAQEIKSQLERNEQISYIAIKKADTESRDINVLDSNRVYNIAFRNRR